MRRQKLNQVLLMERVKKLFMRLKLHTKCYFVLWSLTLFLTQTLKMNVGAFMSPKTFHPQPCGVNISDFMIFQFTKKETLSDSIGFCLDHIRVQISSTPTWFYPWTISQGLTLALHCTSQTNAMTRLTYQLSHWCPLSYLDVSNCPYCLFSSTSV